jgi:hypothetical protein
VLGMNYCFLFLPKGKKKSEEKMGKEKEYQRSAERLRRKKIMEKLKKRDPEKQAFCS